MKGSIQEKVSLPKKSVQNLFEAIQLFESARDEIEDFLISKNPYLLNRLKKAQKERKGGNVEVFDNLLRRYV